MLDGKHGIRLVSEQISLHALKHQGLLLKNEVTAIRRHLHAHPELSFEENETAAFVSAQLHAWNIAHRTGVAGTGIVGDIVSTGDWPCVVLRAELDALPIHEQSNKAYASKKPGLMHACGHDVHTASLLGTLKLLQDWRGRWTGMVRFLFQPGEEKLPGGASRMIREGVLQNPTPQAIVAQHVTPALPAGQIGFRAGMYMASSDEIYITLQGRGGHAAEPEKTVNPIYEAAKLLLSLQQLAEQFSRHSIATVLSFGKVVAAGATNIIPDTVLFEGTLRTFDNSWRHTAHQHIYALIEAHNAQAKALATCQIREGYPPLTNDPVITHICRSAAEAFVGKQNVQDLPMRMASEDFAYFAELVPACFYRLGTANHAAGITSSVHTPTFDIDEEVLGSAPALMAWITMNLLETLRSP